MNTTEETKAAEYSPTAAALADYEKRYKDVVYDVTKPADMAAAKKGRAELRTCRTTQQAAP